MEKVIIGCGYLGRRVASICRDRGDRVIGLVHSASSLAVLQEAGIEAVQADLDQPSPGLPSLQGCRLFYFAPPPREGEEESRVVNLVDCCTTGNRPSRILYLSTTGVYGDCGGAWVDETRPVAPSEPRALRRWDGERRFRECCTRLGISLVIIRVAGFYGPGRLPLARLRAGAPMVRESEAPFTNRIHIDDLVQACLAAMDRGRDGEVYNISDGHPGNMTDYFNRVADAAGLPRPRQIPLAEAGERLSAGMLSYLRESRRLDNRKMRKELGVELRYPDLEAGLASCFGVDERVSGELPEK